MANTQSCANGKATSKTNGKIGDIASAVIGATETTRKKIDLVSDLQATKKLDDDTIAQQREEIRRLEQEVARSTIEAGKVATLEAEVARLLEANQKFSDKVARAAENERAEGERAIDAIRKRAKVATESMTKRFEHRKKFALAIIPAAKEMFDAASVANESEFAELAKKMLVSAERLNLHCDAEIAFRRLVEHDEKGS